MEISRHPDPSFANAAATDLLCRWLTSPDVRNIMVAAGNSPLELYRQVAKRQLALARLEVFALDEYVGVPLEEPDNCGNLLRRSVAEAWGIPSDRFHTVSSVASDALASVQSHERVLAARGGLDVIVLGLGQNGHLGFNEPGSAPDSLGRVLGLDTISITANRQWFSGRYAPDRGVTVGMKTILASRRVLILAYGSHKSVAVTAMVCGPMNARCPASFLQGHPQAFVFLDEAAAAGLRKG